MRSCRIWDSVTALSFSSVRTLCTLRSLISLETITFSLIACTKEGTGDFIVVKGNDVYELNFTPSLTQEDSYIFTYANKTNYNQPENRFKIFVLKRIGQIEAFKENQT